MTSRNAQEGTRMIPGHLDVPEDCRAASEVLARVGDKWTVLVVATLGHGPCASTSCAAHSAAFRNAC
jgi:DNA-binding HxlR family transcriptional regulator